MRVVKLIVLAVVLAVAIPLGLNNATYWRGKVLGDGGATVSGASAALLAGGRVAAVTTTDAEGGFEFRVGWASDTSMRVVLCKPGSEPSLPLTRPSRMGKQSGGRRIIYWLNAANPNFEHPEITRIKPVLPAACQ